jgi:hypothetical protein
MTTTTVERPAVDADQALIDMLNEDPDVVARAGHDATAAFRKATALPFAPIAAIGAAWEAGKTAYAHADRAMNLCHGAAAVAARVELLRTAIKVRDEMQKFADMTQDQRMAASGAKPTPAVSAEVPGSRLNGAEIVALMAKKGLSVNINGTSDLEVHGELDQETHVLLLHQKTQVVRHLLSRRGRVI